jgi:hypothetical protein
MKNFANGKIYKLIDKTNDNIYIGSTTKRLTERLKIHENNYQNFKNHIYPYMTSFDIIKNGNYDIQLLECVNCINNEELLSKERIYIENNICVNKVVPNRSHKESTQAYYEKNKDKINKITLEYYYNNIDKKLQSITCECGKQYKHCHKSRHMKSKYHQNKIKNI